MTVHPHIYVKKKEKKKQKTPRFQSLQRILECILNFVQFWAFKKLNYDPFHIFFLLKMESLY